MVFDCKVSVMVLGEMGIGKTSLLLRFTKDIFKANLNPTSIVNNLSKDVHVMNKLVQLDLWDMTGNKRFRSIVKQFFKKADGVLLMFDLTDDTSCLELSNWLNDLRKVHETAAVFIVGNKNDDPNIKTESRRIAKEFALKENLEYYETNALNGENIGEVFECLVLKVLQAKLIILTESAPNLKKKLPCTLADQNSSISSGSREKTERNYSIPSYSGNNLKQNGFISSDSENMTEENDVILSASESKIDQNDLILSASECQTKETDLILDASENKTQQNDSISHSSSSEHSMESNDCTSSDDSLNSEWIFVEYLSDRTDLSSTSETTVATNVFTEERNILPPIVYLPENFMKLHVAK